MCGRSNLTGGDASHVRSVLLVDDLRGTGVSRIRDLISKTMNGWVLSSGAPSISAPVAPQRKYRPLQK